MSALFLKFGIPVLYVLAGSLAGIAVQQKYLASPAPDYPPCPACVCPEPTVSAQPFDVKKFKGLREFNYAPSFTGSISVAGVDSTALRRMIDRSLVEALAKYDVKKRRR